jgi:hypothetical protein
MMMQRCGWGFRTVARMASNSQARAAVPAVASAMRAAASFQDQTRPLFHVGGGRHDVKRSWTTRDDSGGSDISPTPAVRSDDKTDQPMFSSDENQREERT